ncbi:hypothetical protein HPG69_000861 [Diceros bicornis minor]|uniref:Nucleoside diphosphate-linked moiety X motif 17 n=1 Tax=Diceros bicornis minor TaxID=77932 RepID=A0A7J7E592_DICBM|nr:hypothetical protein HPG69_000861 [Diceros bicornis minor]
MPRPASEALTQAASSRQPLPFCPFAALDQQPRASGPELPKNRDVDLGVAVMLQSSDQTVLLTRRIRALSVSPNLWVPPGGHVELDEESAYPPRLSWGLPKNHHNILYLLLVSQESQQQLQVGLAVEEGNGGSGGQQTGSGTVTKVREREGQR